MQHEFVDCIPETLQESVLYISLQYATAVHKCACGCGHEVVTPFSPTDWSMVFNGEAVSLTPSIGNWGFPCRSHYWIQRGGVMWAPLMSHREIAEGRAADTRRKSAFYNVVETKVAPDGPTPSAWVKVLRWLQRLTSSKAKRG